MPSWLSGSAVCAAPLAFQDPADFDSSIQHTGGLALRYSSFRLCKSHTPSKAHRCCLMCLWQNTGYRGACGNFEPGLTRESWIEFQLRKGHAKICPANDLLNTLRRVTFDLSLDPALQFHMHCSYASWMQFYMFTSLADVVLCMFRISLWCQTGTKGDRQHGILSMILIPLLNFWILLNTSTVMWLAWAIFCLFVFYPCKEIL